MSYGPRHIMIPPVTPMVKKTHHCDEFGVAYFTNGFGSSL